MRTSRTCAVNEAHPSPRDWWAAGAVLALGTVEAVLRWPAMPRNVSLLEITTSWIGNPLGTPMEAVLQVAGLATVLASLSVAILLRQSHPSASVILLWVMIAIHPILGANGLLVELFAMLVIFAVARHAPRRALISMGTSIPIAAAVIVFLTKPNVWVWMLPIDAERALWSSRALLFWVPVAVMLLVGGIPYLIGAYLRSRNEVAHSEAALSAARTELAETAEIARLRADQARLAQDVHDVVGHSLTVIIAQAEAARLSGQLSPAGSSALTHIAEVARDSLHDVRAVLSSAGDSGGSVGGRVGELDELIAGVRAAGYVLDAQTIGRVQPLPPEIEAVAYRSLQEMLTNALRHGAGGHTVSVRQEWGDDVLIEVRNRAAATQPAAHGGAGIPSMESRLTSIGGRLDAYAEGDDFVARARLPLRAIHA